MEKKDRPTSYHFIPSRIFEFLNGLMHIGLRDLVCISQAITFIVKEIFKL